MDEILYSKFKQNPLFQGIEDKDVRALFAEGRRVLIRKGDNLIKEGDLAEEIFFLLEGSLEVYKQDATSRQVETISVFKPGDVIGEMALLDRGQRSASVIARTDAELIGISFSALTVDRESKSYLYKLFFRMAQNMSSRLRQTSNVVLQRQIEDFKNRQFLNEFFIFFLCVICAFFYFAIGAKRFEGFRAVGNYYTWLLTAVLVVCILHIARKSPYSWRLFGITTVHWKRSIYEGIVFTLPVLILIVALKWLFLHFQWTPEYWSGILFNLQISWFDVIGYAFIITPLQELVTRGAGQGILMKVLTGKYKNLEAVLISTLIFSSIHLIASFEIAVLSLLPSLYLGWLYVRNENLIAVWIAHALIGVWGINIVGL